MIWHIIYIIILAFLEAESTKDFIKIDWFFVQRGIYFVFY